VIAVTGARGLTLVKEDAAFDECRRMSFNDSDVKLATLSSHASARASLVGARGFEPLTSSASR
jgi:hypothetical protein